MRVSIAFSTFGALSLLAASQAVGIASSNIPANTSGKSSTTASTNTTYSSSAKPTTIVVLSSTKSISSASSNSVSSISTLKTSISSSGGSKTVQVSTIKTSITKISSQLVSSLPLPTIKTSSIRIVTITDPTVSRSSASSLLLPTIKSSSTRTITITDPIVSKSSVETSSASSSSKIPISSVKTSSPSRFTSASISPAISAISCVGSSTKTITFVSTPVTVYTTYISTDSLGYGPDQTSPTLTVTDTTYTSTFSAGQTLTVTSTYTPSSLVGVTYTSTVLPPSGFISVRDSLRNATYIGPFGRANNPFNRPAKRDADHSSRMSTLLTSMAKKSSSCVIVTITKTIVASTSTSTFTDATGVTFLAYPNYRTTIPAPILTKDTTIVRTDVDTITHYTSTYTSTTTLTRPASSTTVYQACDTNNWADVYLLNGSQVDIGAATGNVPYFTFESASGAYDCCVFCIQNNCGSWNWFETDDGGLCNANIPTSALPDIPQPATTCPPQTTYYAQYTADLRTTQGVVGNGLCGEINHIADQR